MLPRIVEEESVAPAECCLCHGHLGNSLRLLGSNVVSVVMELALKDFEITCSNLSLPLSIISWHLRHKLPRRKLIRCLAKRLEAQQDSGTLQPRTCKARDAWALRSFYR
jgi:hypothetical protein